MGTVSNLARDVRDIINEPWHLNRLLADDANFRKLVAALDAVDDADWAMDTHRQLRHSATEPGELYLLHYGLLAAAGLRQDGVVELCRALGFGDLADKVLGALKAERDARNDVLHATNRHNGKFFMVVRATLTPKSVEVMEVPSAAEFGRRTLNLESLSSRQDDVLSAVLTEVATRLANLFQAEKQKFSDRSFAESLGRSRYLSEKVREDALCGDTKGMLSEHLAMLRDATNAFLAELNVRNIATVAANSVSEANRLLRAVERLEQGLPTLTDVERDGLSLVVQDAFGQLSEAAEQLDANWTP